MGNQIGHINVINIIMDKIKIMHESSISVNFEYLLDCLTTIKLIFEVFDDYTNDNGENKVCLYFINQGFNNILEELQNIYVKGDIGSIVNLIIDMWFKSKIIEE